MSVTQVDLDDEVLWAAMKLMGTSTKKETVNAAPREYVERVERIQAAEKLAAEKLAAEKLAARGAQGEFDQAAGAHAAAKRGRKAELG